MRDELFGEGLELAREIREVREVGVGWRCPGGLRGRVVAFALRRYGEGVSWREVAEELGVGRSTLMRWVRVEREEGARGDLVPVVVRGAMPGAGVGSRGLTLVSPGGYRLEGLDLASAVRLLEELG